MKDNKSALPLSLHHWWLFSKVGLLALIIGGLIAAGPVAASDTSSTGSCDYSVTSGALNVRPNGYLGWVNLKSNSGEALTDFEVLLDIGSATITRGQLAEYEQVDGGYWVTAPSYLAKKPVLLNPRPLQSFMNPRFAPHLKNKAAHLNASPWGNLLDSLFSSHLKKKVMHVNASHRFQFHATVPYQGITPYLISINGMPCDMEPPQVTLTTNAQFFAEEGTLTLSADAQDNVGVHYVEFKKNGVVIDTVWETPYQLQIDVTDDLNGFDRYTVTAYDPSGNSATSLPERVLVAIGNRFFGTAAGGPSTYDDLLTYFNQLTPENAGKWGSVEGQRDVMDWTDLDIAYYFARDHQIPFKFHNLIWGQQQPDWLDALSQEEQLAELNEWMRLLAERYPDLELIEVVNEPLHAPPSYMDALGGSGETGWDWVITAFEMARQHFPRAQLTVNDYQILHLPTFTQEYLEIIHVLQERNLIDAISVQGHFLERADVPLVAANLDTLAATGLPIYVSEFDLNFADDARHANVFRELFTVFWEHPSVVGVTHWGHLEGTVWRPEAYLIRQDGTTRPALDWVMCYLDGGAYCPVPEYVPSGWQGDEYSLTLEAEEFDQGEGLLALGGVVGYTDDGDWLSYSDVEFQLGWDVFSVTYAKGNEMVGNISIHLNSLDNAPLLTVELPPTAGWGSMETIEVPWNPQIGTHDVYVRFNDADGVANIERFVFGTPQPDPEPHINLVNDGGFEGSSLSGWQSWNGSSLLLSTNQSYSGNQSLLATNRPNEAQFAVYNLTSVVQPGTTYAVSAQAFIDGVAPDTVRLSAVVQCTDPPDGHNTYPWLHNLTGVAPGQWVELSANLEIPDCDVLDVAIFFEGTSAGVDVYLDEVRVVPPSVGANLIADGTFESSFAGWSSWNGSSLSLSSAEAYSGSQSLYITDRPNTNQFAVYSLTGLVAPGTTYEVKAQALITGASNDTVRLAAKVECANPPDGHNTFPWLHHNGDVTPGVWTELSADLVIPDCDIVDVVIFFEGTSAGTDVYLDDISVIAQ